MKAYERLLKYVQIDSQSSEESGTHPSTATQFDVAKTLIKELDELGLADVRLDDKCYVYAGLPASPGRENEPAIGFISHMDTAPAFCGNSIHPQIFKNYDGSDITLDAAGNCIMDVKTYPDLLNYIGKTLITTDGTTLLGADDKAGIAEIMTALEEIIRENISHPAIRIAFTPDEEIGEGADYFDVAGFKASYAYTVDGGALGELEYENFNAASGKVTVNGNCIHPGEGKNRMKNALLIAMEFNGMLPPFETPAHTEGYEGFYHLSDMEGNEERAKLNYIIRDHDKLLFEKRKATFARIADYLNDKYGAGTIELNVKDSYYNMREALAEHMDVVERAKEAFLKCGVTPKIQPIRGGTDGARLSFMGLPCPNLSTGGHNFHGKYEYIPVESMDKMVEVIKEIINAPQ